MREKVLKLYKNLGETPLACLERFRADNPEYATEKMTYAGRLDPMAEGLLIALVGEECKKKEEYLDLDKEYIYEVLFGVQTDTYDILGIPRLVENNPNFNLIKSLKNIVGKQIQKYPAYSSKTINGKPLFQMTRDGEDFESPVREVEIFNTELLEEQKVSADKFLKDIVLKINLVQGDFRQEEIIKSWQKLLSESEQEFKIAKIKINCSSGTYIRSICNSFGGVAYSIKRTKVGDFSL